MPANIPNIHPFQTGRFKKEYTRVEQSGEHFSQTGRSEYQDCLQFETTLTNGMTILSTRFYTNYSAIDNNNEEVYITEYKRKLSRKIKEQSYQQYHRGRISGSPLKRLRRNLCFISRISKKQKRILTKCGEDILTVIDRVLPKYPLEKECEYWIELEFDESFEELPLFILYVVQKMKHIAILDYSERYTLPYNVKRGLFVEALKNAYTLLHYQLFTKLIMMHNFLIRLDTARSSDSHIYCTISISALFDVIITYVFNCDDEYKNIQLNSRKRLQKKFLGQPLYVVMQTVMLWLFKAEGGHQWRDLIDDLPKEMYMIYLRMNNEIILFRNENLKKLLNELTHPTEQTRIECFEKVKLLGSGSFGDVHLARHKGSGVHYAIKVIKNYNQSLETTRKLFEAVILATQFNHKNIVKYYDAWTSNDHCNWISKITIEDTDFITSSEIDSSNTFSYYTAKTNLENSSDKYNMDHEWNCDHRYTFIVLQACRSSLHSLMQNNELLEGQCIRYIKEFIQGLEYLNSIGFMHRDVKPQNALIAENGRLLIADLDTIKRIKQVEDNENISQTLVRTPAYVSPEMHSKIYNERTDYYSIGIAFAKMICPEQCRGMETFLSLIHADRLPDILHPQYAFIIRWLTETNPVDRIAFWSFSSLFSLLERHKYHSWLPRAFNAYSIMIEHHETRDIMQCLRVKNSKSTIREMVKRYSRRPKYNQKEKYKLRIESAFAFEANCQLSFDGSRLSCIELMEDRLVIVNQIVDYVYICYSVLLSQEEELSAHNFEEYIPQLFDCSFDTFTRWGTYSIASFSRCPFYQDCFIIEPCMLDMVSAEYIQTQIAQFWPPDKIFDGAPMSEAGAVFSFGIYMLWNLLLSLEVSENDRIITIRQLQEGIRPELLGLLESHVSQLILWLCAHKPKDRPFIRSIPNYFERIDRPPTVDERFSFRLTYDDIEFTDVKQRDGTTIKYKTSSLWKEKGWKLFSTRKDNRSIYTISNTPGVMEKVMNRLKICGNFFAIPRRFARIEYLCDAPEIEAQFMLDINHNDHIIILPRSSGAVDWLIEERASDYLQIADNYNIRSLVLPYIHNTFISVLKSLSLYHKQGIWHGNINFSTFLLDKNGHFCLANPLLIEEDTVFCSREAYLTEYSSPEQMNSPQGSPQSDVFSLGITLFVLLCNYHHITQFHLNIFQSDQELIFPNEIEPEYCDLIRQMTKLDANERINCDKALEIFNATCSHYLEEVEHPERKLHVDNTNKTEYQLGQLISK